MDKVYIPQLQRMKDGTDTIEFREFFPDLPTLTPVQGVLQLSHRGAFLEVKVKAMAIMTLTCDRTLVQFNHRLEVDTSELIWLTDLAGKEVAHHKEREIELDDLVESLSPTGYFDPNTWLYEQLCLALPYPVIAPDAPEHTPVIEELDLSVGTQGNTKPSKTGQQKASNQTEDAQNTKGKDKRWAALAALKLNDDDLEPMPDEPSQDDAL